MVVWVHPNTEYCSQINGNRGGTGKNRQNSSGTGIAKFASATPLMTVLITAKTGVASIKGVPPAKEISYIHPVSQIHID